MLVLAIGLAGCIGTDFVDENPADPTLQITPPTGAVVISQSIQFSGEYRDGFDVPVSGKQIEWHSSNPDVASIDANGVATGNSAGQVFITGTVEGVASAPANLTVVADAMQVAYVTIDVTNVMVSAGSSHQLAARAFNVLDEELPGASFSWSSSDTAVATVDATGNVTGVATGQTNIVASADGVVSLPTVITVPGRTKTGEFAPAPGSSYTVRGTASLVELGSGGLQVEFGSDFVVSDGPDIQVYVSSTSTVSSSSVNLGLVKSKSGAQTYEVPSSVNYGSVNYVIIHCVSFNVTFGQAAIQ